MRRLNNNRTILQQKYPVLFSKINTLEPHSYELELKPSTESAPTLLITHHQKTQSLYSAISPLKKIRKEIDQYQLNTVSNVILIGFGLGYYAKILTENFPNLNKILIVVIDPIIFKFALNQRPIDSILNSDKITLVHETDLQHEWIQKFLSQAHLPATGIKIIPHTLYDSLFPNEFEHCKKTIFNALSIELSLKATRINRGKEMQSSIIQNLLQIGKCHSIQLLKDCFTGLPALLLAPGTTLTKQLPHLQKCKETMLTIAVDTAVPTLLTASFFPHFILTTDYADHNLKNFSGLFEQPSHLFPTLIADVCSHPQLIQNYPGPVLFFDHGNIISNYFLKNSGDYTVLDNQLSTSYAAMSFAVFLDCSPIILVGYDLGYYPDSAYSKGSIKNKSITQTEKGYFLNNQLRLKETRDIKNQLILQDAILANQQIVIESFIQNQTHPFINAGEGGVLRNHCEIKSLSDLLLDFPKVSISVPTQPAKKSIKKLTYQLEKTYKTICSLEQKFKQVQNKLPHTPPLSDSYKQLQNSLRYSIESNQDLAKILSAILEETQISITKLQEQLKTEPLKEKQNKIHLQIDALYTNGFQKSFNFYKTEFKRLIKSQVDLEFS